MGVVVLEKWARLHSGNPQVFSTGVGCVTESTGSGGIPQEDVEK